MNRIALIVGMAWGAISQGGCVDSGDNSDQSTAQQASFGGSLGSVVGNPVASNNTTGLVNDHQPTCASSSAPDLAYAWTSPATGTYTFSTVGSATTYAPFDTILQVRDFNTGASLGCNDDSAGTLQSTVSVNLAIGQTVRIVVDGYGTANGTFRLSIAGSGERSAETTSVGMPWPAMAATTEELQPLLWQPI